MKNETKALLTMQGTLSSIARVSEHIDSMISKGNTVLEEKIIDSGKTINDCWEYITFKAKETAGSDNNVCIDDETVFGWAVHFYEDNDQAAAEMKPKQTTKPTAPATPTAKTGTSKSKTKAKATTKAKPKAEHKGFTQLDDDDDIFDDEPKKETQEDVDFILGDDDNSDCGVDLSDIPF